MTPEESTLIAVNSACPVCRGEYAHLLVEVNQQRYYRCSGCLATFIDPAQRPSANDERAEYDLHQNHVDDAGYRRFLEPAVNAAVELLAPGARILDYGCGPGPALAAMLQERGYQVSLFDPIYRPDRSVFSQRFDAITCTEVVEHFHEPAAEFSKLNAMLNPGGVLIIMTRFQTDDKRFANWHYRRDPTHVVFYRAETFQILGRGFGWEVDTRPPNLAVIRKPLAASPGASVQQTSG